MVVVEDSSNAPVREGLLDPSMLRNEATQPAHGLKERSRRRIARSAGMKGGGVEMDREDALSGDDRCVDHEERRELGRQDDVPFGRRTQRDTTFGDPHGFLRFAPRREATFRAARPGDGDRCRGGMSFSFCRYDSPSMSTVTRCCVKRSISGTRLAAP